MLTSEALIVFGTEPSGSVRLIGELLPANGGFYHYPTDGLHHHRNTIDAVGVRGGSRLQHHGRSAHGKAEPARREAVRGGLVLEHEELAEALSPGLQAHRPLRHIAVTDVLTPLAHYPPAVGTAHTE